MTSVLALSIYRSGHYKRSIKPCLLRTRIALLVLTLLCDGLLAHLPHDVMPVLYQVIPRAATSLKMRSWEHTLLPKSTEPEGDDLVNNSRGKVRPRDQQAKP
jgi:hypothetical protein